MRTVKFKREGDKLFIQGQEIGAHNLTPEVYDSLIALNPNLADHFEVTEESTTGKPVSAKTAAKSAE